MENNMNNTFEVEQKIDELFRKIGVPFHLRGYSYLKELLIMLNKDDRLALESETELYSLIAKKYDSTTSRVKRAIRYLIEVVWNRGDIDILNSYFGNGTIYDKDIPTNIEFIAMIFDKIK